MSEQEIQTQMSKLYQTQQTCLKLQLFLVVLTAIAYKFGFIPLFLNFLVAFIWGVYLQNKATALAKEKYPYLKPQVHVARNRFSVGLPLVEEATRCNDSLSLKVLRFTWRSTLAVAASFFIYFLVVILRSFLLP